MFKKILNKKEIEVFNYTARPFIIYCILVAIILIIGSNYGSMTTDEINGYIESLTLYFIINYLNLTYIELSKTKNKYINKK